MSETNVPAPGPAPSRHDDVVVDVARVELENEVARLRQQVVDLESEPPRRRGRIRGVVTWVLVVLTSIMVALSAVSVWLRATVLDTDEFMAAVQPALEDPQVRQAMGDRLTTETFTALALEDRLSAALADVGDSIGAALVDALELSPAQAARVEALPLPGLEQLAGPIAGGIESRIAQRVDEYVTSEAFGDQLVTLTREAHTRAVALVREDYGQLPNLVIESGEVRINLVPAVAGVLADLVDQGLDAVGIEEIPFIDPTEDPEASLARLSAALDVQLPPDFGQVTVMSQAELTELQDAARTADQLVWAMLLGTLALAAVTLAVAPDRRRGLLQLSLGAAVGVTLTMLLVRNTEDEIAAVAVTPQGERALAVLADSTFDTLRTVMVAVLVVALLVAVVAHLAGRPPWLRRSVAYVRRTTARRPGGSDLERFVAAHHDPLRIAVIALGVLVLVVTGIGLVSLVVVTAAVLAALWGLAALRARVPAVPADADVAITEDDDREPPAPGDVTPPRAGERVQRP